LPDYINGKIETGIVGIQEDEKTGRLDDSWYSLDGRRLSGMPVKPGLYINRGKKTVIR